MSEVKRQTKEEKAAEKARFFLKHGQVMWAIEECELFDGLGLARVCAASLGEACACDELFDRVDDFDRWIDAALSLPPTEWGKYRESWARALAALSAQQDASTSDYLERLLPAAPASIGAMEMEGSTARDWLADHLDSRHGDWLDALDRLMALGHDPKDSQESLVEKPYKPSSALNSLCSALYGELAISDYGYGSGIDIIGRSGGEDRVVLCLSALPQAIKKLGGGNPAFVDEVRYFFEECFDEAIKATPAMIAALAREWANALEGLIKIDSMVDGEFWEAMAAKTPFEILDMRQQRNEQRAVRELLLDQGGKFADLVHRLNARQEEEALQGSTRKVSRLKEILESAKSKRSCRL